MTIIENAALRLYNDPRREIAVTTARKISDYATLIVADYGRWFDTTHCTVSGSTSRGTHLPDDSDFDIGLLPLRNGLVDDYEWQFRELVGRLWEQLTSDSDLVKRLSEQFGISETDAQNCFSGKRKPLIDDHENPEEPYAPRMLVTAKFETLAGKSILEVSAGNNFWHRVGLAIYNGYWHRQLQLLKDPDRTSVLLQICLLKQFTRRLKRKHRTKFPSSRTLEQLVMQQMLRRSDEPLVDAMRMVQGKPQVEVVKEVLTLPVPYEMLNVHNEQAARSGDNPKTWANLHEVAEAILKNDTEWVNLLAELTPTTTMTVEQAAAADSAGQDC